MRSSVASDARWRSGLTYGGDRLKPRLEPTGTEYLLRLACGLLQSTGGANQQFLAQISLWLPGEIRLTMGGHAMSPLVHDDRTALEMRHEWASSGRI